MFERFTDRARRVLVLAENEARRLGHSVIGPEHLLLGVVGEGEGLASKVLESLGVGLEAVRAEVLEVVGPAGALTTGPLGFTPRGKKVMELSLREALQLRHNYIGTEHLLLGLVREGEGVAGQVLARLGADLPRVREEVTRLLSAGAEGHPEPSDERAGDGRVPETYAHPMFERFTDRARRVLVLAQEEARLLEHNFIGTEHLLLGLISEGEGVAAKALENLGIALQAVRSKVKETIGPASGELTGPPPFTPRAKKVLELSLREALPLGHNYIGTEHMLLGLAREGEGVAAQVLEDLGADLSEVRAAVMGMLSGYAGKLSPEARAAGSEPAPRCPSCSIGLAENTAYRFVNASNEEGGDPVRIMFLHCAGCGTALGTAS